MRLKQYISRHQTLVYSLLHQLLLAVYGFALLFLLFHLSSREEAGRWLLFVSAISLADMVMHGFLQTPVIRLLSASDRSTDSINSMAANIIAFALAIWSILSISVLVANNYIDSELTRDLLWYPILGLLMIAYNAGWWINHALSDFRSIFLQRVIFVVVSFSIILYSYITTNELLTQNIIISQIVAYLISNIISWLKIRKLRPTVSQVKIAEQKYFFNYGKYTAGSMMMGSLLRNADIFMIAAFLGQAQVAVYSAAQKMVEIFEVVLRGLAAHSLPEFCKLKDSPEILLRQYRKKTSQLMLVFLVPSILMFIFSKEIIHLISGSSQYSDASIILKVFMVYVLFLIADRMTGVTLEAMGMARHNFTKMIALMVVNITGNFIALYYFRSLTGVAIVSIAATASGVVLGAFFLISHSGIAFRLKSVFPKLTMAGK